MIVKKIVITTNQLRRLDKTSAIPVEYISEK